MRAIRVAFVGVLVSLAAMGLRAPRAGERSGEAVIFDMDTVRHKPTPFGKEKKPAGTVELAEGKFGKACTFTFAEGASGGFFVAGVRATPEWDKAAGISFWAKGDGSANWGGIELFAAKLKQTYGSEVTLVNVSRGGSQLTHGLLQMPLWLRETPEPDLVTVWYGFNDWSDGMRGDHFQEVLSFAIDRIRRMTKGKSEVLLMTTCPAVGRWDEMEEMAGAARVVAMKKKTGLADVALAFHKAGADEKARLALYCTDKTHLGAEGHKLAAETVVKVIGGSE